MTSTKERQREEILFFLSLSVSVSCFLFSPIAASSIALRSFSVDRCRFSLRIFSNPNPSGFEWEKENKNDSSRAKRIPRLVLVCGYVRISDRKSKEQLTNRVLARTQGLIYILRRSFKFDSREQSNNRNSSDRFSEQNQ